MMRYLLLLVCLAGMTAINRVYGETVPAILNASACATPPTIDGEIKADEWNSATIHRIELPFVRISPAVSEQRNCELRVMNSANGLYIAFTVPDTTVDDSLSPMRLDAAILATTTDDGLHSDRKLVAADLYRDKYKGPSGQDDLDDAQQDGVAVMKRSEGFCTFEWALPLNAPDGNDLQVKPGGEFQFNLTYFDGFQLPLTQTIMGGLYGPALDKVASWGTVRLAEDVQDDGGQAFQPPAWVTEVTRVLNEPSSCQMRVTGQAIVSGLPPGTSLVQCEFDWLDQERISKKAQAKIYFPAKFDPASRHSTPMFFAAGYELPDVSAAAFLKRGWIVVSPSQLPTNPLIRLMNPDVALMHFARDLPWIDDSKVVIGGGSAGGWMTLMLAAETFPLGGAAPDVPPVHWGYNAAYFFKQLEKCGPARGQTTARVPALFGVGTMLTPAVDDFGGEFGDDTWYADSPVAQLSTITCPVSIYWSTADVLVPIDQVGTQWVQQAAADTFPQGFTFQPAELLSQSAPFVPFLDALSPDSFELFELEVPQGVRRENGAEESGRTEFRELPISSDKTWSISIVDEGAPVPDMDHRKYAFGLSRENFYDRISHQAISIDQLTLSKLQRLMSRYAGREWLPSRLQHLDRTDAEQRDVLRGLRTFASVSPAHRERLRAVYEQLAESERALPVHELAKLLGE